MEQSPPPFPKAVSYDGNSLIIDGQRQWLMSGSMHFFRVPPEEWADRLDQYGDALLNCVEIYLPWNLLEPMPGHFEFTGLCDLERFLELCRERRLFVLLRPGPYICAEWDLGGLPAWLIEEGVSLRGPDPVYLRHVERYFNEVFRRIGHYQRTESADGPIILAQVENEFWMSHPEGLRHLDEIRRLLLAAGASVPLTDCNMLYNTPPTLHTINGGWNYPANFQRMRREFPDQPLLATEFHCGWFTTTVRGPSDGQLVERGIFRDTLRYVARGVMLNRYMFIGGTNFGNWGARTAAGEFVTASYDFLAPVTEGGGRSEKYYYARLANRIERLFADQLAQSPRPCEAVYIHAHPHAITRQTPAGDLVFIFKTIDNEPEQECVPLIFGIWRRCTARFTREITARVMPVAFTIAPDVQVDFCEPQLFHIRECDGVCELFLYDSAGQTAELSINNLTRLIEFPGPEGEPVTMNWDNRIRLRLFNLQQALRFTPAETAAGFQFEAKPEPPPAPEVRWRPWRGIGFDPKANGSAPAPVAGFASLGKLGAPYDQGIFAFHRHLSAPVTAHLYLRDLHDRAHIFVNGRLAGTLGMDTAATCQPLPVSFEPGANKIWILLGNWGHDTDCHGHSEGKGFAGAPCLVKPVAPEWSEAPAMSLQRRDIKDWLSANMMQNAHIDLDERFTLHPWKMRLPLATSLHVAIPSQAAPFFVFLDGQLAHVSTGRGWSIDIERSHTTLKIAFIRPDLRAAFAYDRVVVAANPTPLAPSELHFAPLARPNPAATNPVVSNQPAWFVGGFHLATIPVRGLLLDLASLSRGRVWLNGRLLARYWIPSPQTRYWIPASWLAQANDLVLFDEEGRSPAQISLEQQSHGPFRRTPDAVWAAHEAVCRTRPAK